MMKKLHKDNSGSAMVMVIIALAFIAILISTLFWVTMTNFFMKYTDAKNKENFYSAETIFEEMKAGMQTDASKILVEVYAGSFADYTNGTSEAELQERYLTKVYDHYRKGFNEFYPQILVGYVEDGFNPFCEEPGTTSFPGTLVTNSDGKLYETAIYVPKINPGDPPLIEKGETEVILKNITVKFYDHDNGYYSEITSDLAVGLPNIRFSKASELPAVFDYDIVSDGLKIEDNVIFSSFKNIYSGIRGITIGDGGSAHSLKGASADFSGADYIVTRGNISINGITNNESGGKAKLKTGMDTRLYAKSIDISYGDSDLAGKTYVANDLAYKAAGKTKITGDYYGFGNSTRNAAESSAIIMNTKDSELDVSGANSVLLAGHAFVGTSDKGVKKRRGEKIAETKRLILYKPDRDLKPERLTVYSWGSSAMSDRNGQPMNYDEETGYYYFYLDEKYNGTNQQTNVKGMLPFYADRVRLSKKLSAANNLTMASGYANLYVGCEFDEINDDKLPEGYGRTGEWTHIEIPEKFKYTTESVFEISETGIYVFLNKPDNWTTPYIHAWGADDETWPEWPGKPMEYDPETGYYYLEISRKNTGYKFVDAGHDINSHSWQIPDNGGNYTIPGLKPGYGIFHNKKSAGTTYKLPDKFLESAENIHNILMDQSISVKGDQVAYLIPGSCIGVWRGNDGTTGETLVGMNPVPGITVSINAAGDVEPLFNSARFVPDNYDSNTGYVETVNFDTPVHVLGGKKLSDYTRNYRVVYKTQYGQTLAYFYIDLDEEMAKQYMQDYYGMKKESVDKFYDYYTSGKYVTESASGNMTSAGHFLRSDADELGLSGSNTSSMEQSQNNTDIAATYEALYTKLVTDSSDVTAVERTRTVYQNLISENRMPTGEVIYKSTGIDEDDEVYAVLTGGSVNYPADFPETKFRKGSGESKIHLIIAEGDVTLEEDFSGLILCKGQVTIKNAGGAENEVKVEGDREALSRLLKTDYVESGTPKSEVNKPMDVFIDGTEYILEGTPVSSNGVKADDQVIDFGELVRYENWTKK